VGDDPRRGRSVERYREALERSKYLFNHPWFKELLREKKSISLLDVGAGRGIGGVAFAEVLRDMGIECIVDMVDLRRDALKDAEEFAQEKGVKARTYVMDALEVYKLEEYDVVLMYGATLAHFNEWDIVKLFASSAQALKEKGIIIVDEMDRVNYIFRGGFKELIVENPDPDKLTISVHHRYDVVTGSYYREFVSLKKMEIVTVSINFRSIAHIASLLWIFTKDVDIVGDKPPFYLVLGRGKRGKILVSDLEPTTVSRRGIIWSLNKTSY